MTTTTEHLKRLAEAATPGPWVREDEDDTSYCLVGPMGNYGVNDLFRIHSERDADFIAATNPATIKALCELVEQMGRAMEHLMYSDKHAIQLAAEALAAYEAFQKGEPK